MSQLPPCPQCSSEYTYEDGVQRVCPECGHEWSEAEAAAADAAKTVGDANGTARHGGATVTVKNGVKVCSL